MSHSLIFDTETTGMILRDQPSTAFGQPDIVQICAQLWDDDSQELVEGFTQYVIPEKKIHPMAFKAHGISLEDIEKNNGVQPNVMLDHFLHLVDKADTLVAFNIAFDKKVIEAAMFRARKSLKLFTSKNMVCAMLQAAEELKIEDPKFRGQWKWPRLSQAYEALVDPAGFENAHDAEADVVACAKVYYAMRNRNVK